MPAETRATTRRMPMKKRKALMTSLLGLVGWFSVKSAGVGCMRVFLVSL